MLTLKINPLKLALEFFNQKEVSRYSILDMIVLLLINDHPHSGKSDLCELLYNSRSISKSSLDRPVKRLLAVGWIEQFNQLDIPSKKGGARFTYKISKKGLKILESCK